MRIIRFLETQMTNQFGDEILDENRGYTAYVKLNDNSCLFSTNRDSGFYEIYSGSWKN